MTSHSSNKHRYFTQFLLTNGLVTLSNALSFLEEISPEQCSLTHLKTLIIEVNRNIANHSFKIATTTCEVTSEQVLVWLNMKNDEISRLHVGFTAVELEYFHAIMQEIVTSEEHRILYPRAINISSTLTATLTRENGEKALKKWTNGGYFVKLDQFVYLGPRTILEFTSYLRTNAENCMCDLCAELVFVGKQCSSCGKTFHSFCINRYLQNQHTCPSCKEEWDDNSTNTHMEVDESGHSSQ